MADLAKAVQLTAQMYHMRDTMRSLCGPQYSERVAKWQSAITNVAKGKKLDPLQAAIQLAKAANGNGFAVIAVMAAYVEMIEPSIDAPQGVAA